MPIATPEKYAEMLDTAKSKAFAFPAINVSSSQTLNAALAGFAEAGSDGIIQVSTGGAEYLSGPTIKDMVTGSVAFAAYAAEVAKSYPVNIALHTDHCPKDKLDGFVRPLIDISAERVARGEAPLFQSHMWDGSAVPLDENLKIAEELLAKCAAARIILEIEVGVVGGEEDGVEGAIDEKLYTHPQDALDTVAALGLGEKGRYLTALTFGNVHGVYKPGNVKLRPEILQKAQEAVIKQLGLPFRRNGRAVLWDGSEVTFDIYEAVILWDGRPRRVSVDAADTDPLLGTGLLSGHELSVQFIEGGEALIRSLPLF